MTEPMKYDDLDFTPSRGFAEVRKGDKCWQIPVEVDCGRDMEAAGITVYWAYAYVPEIVARLGLTSIYAEMFRLFTWPSRWGKK